MRTRAGKFPLLRMEISPRRGPDELNLVEGDYFVADHER